MTHYTASGEENEATGLRCAVIDWFACAAVVGTESQVGDFGEQAVKSGQGSARTGYS